MTTEPLPVANGPVETKTKAGALAAYVGAFVLFAVLTNTATDLSFLPDWVETIIYPLIPAIVAFLGAYLKSHKPGQLSQSARYAARHAA
jgi:predicted lysophospholipase L1 biosynthesis ABC-type transport system permease subunit